MKGMWIMLVTAAVLGCITVPARSQGKPGWISDRPFSRLDPAPLNPAVDPDIDLFINHWSASEPVMSHGGTVREHMILTPNDGDVMQPVEKGAVLTYVNKVSYCFLDPGRKTSVQRLENEQYIYYFVAGEGSVTAGNESAPVHDAVGILMPPGLDYAIESTGGEALAFYIIAESLPEGFEPNNRMIVRNEENIPLADVPGHWAHVPKSLFWQADDNTALFVGMNPVWIDPMTMNQPHSHQPGVEEIWLSLKGNFDILLGKEIRHFPAGSAMRIPPDGHTPHATINTGDVPIKTMWMMRIPAHGDMSPLNVY